MNFNEDELALAALAPRYQFTKEGVLFTPSSKKSQKKSKTVKSSNAFVERWFCLRANLLFCMKGIERTSGVAGVIILERCSVQLDSEESDHLFSFIIAQEGLDEPIYLACRNDTDRDEWMGALQAASYECMKMQMDSLREQITVKIGRDPIAFPHLSTAWASPLMSEDEAPYVEMCLSCSQLRCTNDGSPHVMIDILSLIPPSISWQLIGQTEIVEQSHNPLFMKTIGLGDQLTPTRNRIKLVVYDVRELVSRTRTQIGHATFILEDLLSANKLSLDIISSDRSQVGSVNVMAWATTTPSDDASRASANVQKGLTSAWLADKSYRTKKKDQLKFLFSNTICKVFRFPTLNSHELSVCEMMGESKLTFVLPLTYLKFMLQEYNQWKDSIRQLNAVHTRFTTENAQLVSRLTAYTEQLAASIHCLEGKHSKQTFKASQQKGDKSLEAIPLNLHIHRLIARNEYTQTGDSHDFITVGAFAAHPRGFKHGGLWRTLRLNSPDASYPLIVLKLSHLLEAVQELDSLRCSIFELCEAVEGAVVGNDCTALMQASDFLKVECDKLFDLCSKQPLIVESMLNFHSSMTNGKSASTNKSGSSPRLNHLSEDDDLSAKGAYNQQTWDGTVSSVLEISDRLMVSVKACGQDADDVADASWEKVRSDKMQCEAFVEKLYKHASLGLTHCSVQRAADDPFGSSVDQMMRLTAVQSQALTAAVTGLLAKVRFNITDDEFLEQIAKIGCLMHMEGLLSCHGSETGMLEDFIAGAQWLSSVEFKFVESSSALDDYLENSPLITGNRLQLLVTLPLPSSSFHLLPESLQDGCPMKIVPVLFNVGFNETATLAENLGSTLVQDRVNKQSYQLLMDYCTKYQSVFGPVGSTANSRYSLTELLTKLEQCIGDNKKKNMEILHLSSEIGRKLRCIRYTSCKSAKDRTAMAVTLEECRILQQQHDLAPHLFEKALSCLRSEGVRRQNTLKNAGVMSYAFSSFQLLSFPKLYRPPTGTYGKGET